LFGLSLHASSEPFPSASLADLSGDLRKDAVMITQTLTTEAFQALGAPDLVYVRPITAADVVASGVPASALDEFDLAPEQILYALHSADGARIAVLADRPSAYAAALAHELAPVSVH
jgi:hypothetical protein